MMAAADTLTYAVTDESWVPYWMVDDGQVSGVLSDVMHALDERLAVDLQAARPAPPLRAQKMFRDGQVQLECCVSQQWRTAPEQVEVTLWTEPVLEAHEVLVFAPGHAFAFTQLADLRGKTIAVIYHDSPFGSEVLPIINRRAEMHGFTVLALPVPPPGVEQRAIWLQIRQQRPDFVILQTWGVMTATAIRQAVATGFPRDRMFGLWWSGAEPDLRDIGADARGFSAVMMQHGQARDSEVVRQILAQVHDRGQGTGPRAEVGDVLYMRGVVGAMLAVEGVFRAQERFGRGRHVTGEQARWGYENLNITQARLDQLGFAGVLRGPIVTSCRNHVGTAMMRIHTWNGSGFDWSSDWLQADMNVINRMVTASAESFARDNNITRRTEPGC